MCRREVCPPPAWAHQPFSWRSAIKNQNILFSLSPFPPPHTEQSTGTRRWMNVQCILSDTYVFILTGTTGAPEAPHCCQCTLLPLQPVVQPALLPAPARQPFTMEYPPGTIVLFPAVSSGLSHPAPRHHCCRPRHWNRWGHNPPHSRQHQTSHEVWESTSRPLPRPAQPVVACTAPLNLFFVAK